MGNLLLAMLQIGINETELLSRLQLGDSKAYSLLHEQYWEYSRLLNLCRMKMQRKIWYKMYS